MQESGEMYLETILVLSQKMTLVRSIDVAEEMGYSKPSISRAMGILKNSGHITIDTNGGIKLTESGRKIAEGIYERHTVLSKILMSLGVSEETAVDDACKIEHHISDESFEAVKKALKDHPDFFG